MTVVRPAVDVDRCAGLSGDLQFSVINVDGHRSCPGKTRSGNSAKTNAAAAKNSDRVLRRDASTVNRMKTNRKRLNQTQLLQTQVSTHNLCRRNRDVFSQR